MATESPEARLLVVEDMPLRITLSAAMLTLAAVALAVVGVSVLGDQVVVAKNGLVDPLPDGGERPRQAARPRLGR